MTVNIYMMDIEPEDDDLFDDEIDSLEDEFKYVSDAVIGTNGTSAANFHLATLYEDDDNPNLFVIKGANGKTVGKLYIYEEDDD